MSEFEYLLVINSLLLSFAIARMIGGLQHVFAAGRRYWIHAVWVVAAIVNILFSWWIVFQYRDAAWTYLRFVLWLTPSALLLYVANLLVPENAGDIENWRDRFYEIRKRLMAAHVLFAGFVIAINYVALDPQPPGSLVGPVPGALIVAIGYAFENEGVQGAVVILELAVLVTLGIMFNVRPMI